MAGLGLIPGQQSVILILSCVVVISNVVYIPDAELELCVLGRFVGVAEITGFPVAPRPTESSRGGEVRIF